MPTRTCIGCRTTADQRELVRVAADGEVAVFDLARALPGRGAYLHPAQQCLDRAITRRAFSRSLRANVSTDLLCAPSSWYSSQPKG